MTEYEAYELAKQYGTNVSIRGSATKGAITICVSGADVEFAAWELHSLDKEQFEPLLRDRISAAKYKRMGEIAADKSLR